MDNKLIAALIAEGKDKIRDDYLELLTGAGRMSRELRALAVEETMRCAVLFCAVGLLSGCVSDSNGSYQRPADPSRTVSIHYSTPGQYRNAARQADAYCAERFNARAQPTGGYMGSGGDATFSCVN